MATQSLAVKYRPTSFDDVTEQGAVKIILKQQLDTDTIKNAYLFCGGAGTGKTTCARIFANEINKGQGSPIEIDAASNNSVDDVRNIIQQAKTQSLNSTYKIFILDEVHMLSNGAWNAMLKLLEEPPKNTIFIFATTDPQKIPKTILSRVQRYDFQRISSKGICDRLHTIMVSEELAPIPAKGYDEALEYIAKIADGGMRDAITLLDKCLSYSTELTVDNVISALGLVDYNEMRQLTNAILDSDINKMIDVIESVYSNGKDIKLFTRNYLTFVLDINKYGSIRDFRYIKIPNTYTDWLNSFDPTDYLKVSELLKVLLKVNADIKWDSSPKDLVESNLIVFLNNT